MLATKLIMPGLAEAPGLIFALVVLWMLTRATLRQQAIVGWVGIKFLFFIVCGTCITMALPLWLRDHRADLPASNSHATRIASTIASID